MGDKELHPSMNEEVDLSKNTSLSNKISQPHPLTADGHDPLLHGGETVGEEPDLPIPNFLLKNKNNDLDESTDDKFVNKSFKMVQDACKTLADDTLSGTGSGTGSNNADVTPPIIAPVIAAGALPDSLQVDTAPSRSWFLPTAFAVLAMGATALYHFQPSMLSGSFAARENSNDENLLQVASSTSSNSSWGFAMAQNSRKQMAPAKPVEEASSKLTVSSVGENEPSAPTMILDSNQNSSLKARLSDAVALNLEKQKPAPVQRSAVVNRTQIAALVAEQTAPKATRSLKSVDQSARELEAEIKVATAPAPAPVSVPTPVVSAPVVKAEPVKVQEVRPTPAPSVQLAQLSNSGADKLRALTDNVVDQLARLKKFEENPQTAEIPASSDLRNSIAQLVQQASSQNLDSGAIEGLLNEALNNSNSVPAALAKADGSLDTRLLLMSVLAQADASKVKSSDQDYLSALDDEGSETVVTTSLVSAVSVQPQIQDNVRITTEGSRRTIKIVTGDTLSKIAQLVYGDVLLYTDIYKANRNILRSPNLLTVGTTLVLP